jgi:hypothetical protein
MIAISLIADGVAQHLVSAARLRQSSDRGILQEPSACNTLGAEMMGLGLSVTASGRPPATFNFVTSYFGTMPSLDRIDFFRIYSERSALH